MQTSSQSKPAAPRFFFWVRITLWLTVLFFGWRMVAGGEPTVEPDASEPAQLALRDALKPLVADETDDTVRFIAFGDSGSGASFQHNVARQMMTRYRAHPFSHALVLGDIIYERGEIEKYGQTRYYDVYKPLMDAGVRFWPVFGNHDVLFRDAAGIARSLDFYKMPGRYYSFVRGPVRFIGIDTNMFNALQQQWLDNTLKNNASPVVVVYGHHPVYSTGQHGNTPQLVQALKPILERHHVPLYLAGHDHGYERYTPINGVSYVVAGGGGAYLRDFETSAPTVKIRRKVHHFLWLEATADTIRMAAIDAAGAVVDSVSIPVCQPAGKACQPKPQAPVAEAG